MISKKCMVAYWMQYPDGGCGYAEPSDIIIVCDNENMKSYRMPADETDDTFMDRLKRSKDENKNLFFTEWEEIKNIPGAQY